ncbi:Homeobox protein LOX2 [Harpegnathos saltator]|uniref:Homeobox protein LOX2 n=1 Tax=Harpegnathos saltator TaxID=610380 RepID=E2B5W0_HARSA|nr:Homeobox protein LOX2 [Harpegnathos saltator]
MKECKKGRGKSRKSSPYFDGAGVPEIQPLQQSAFYYDQGLLNQVQATSSSTASVTLSRTLMSLPRQETENRSFLNMLQVNSYDSYRCNNQYNSQYINYYNIQNNCQYNNPCNGQIGSYVSDFALTAPQFYPQPMTTISPSAQQHLQYEHQSAYDGNKQNYLPYNAYSNNYNHMPPNPTTKMLRCNLMLPTTRPLQKIPQSNNTNILQQQYTAQQNYAGDNNESESHITANNQGVTITSQKVILPLIIRSLLEVSGHVYATQQYAAEQNYAGDNSKQQSPIAANSQDSPVLKSLLEEPQHNDINTIQQYAAQQNYAGNNSKQQNHVTTNNQVSPILRPLLEAPEEGNIYATQQYAAQQNYAGDNSKQQSPIAANSQDSPVSRSSQEASRQSDINTVQQYAAQQNYAGDNSKQQSPIAANYQLSPNISRPLQEEPQYNDINIIQQYAAQQNYAGNSSVRRNHLVANNQVSPILRPLLEAPEEGNIYATQQYAAQKNYAGDNSKQQSPIAANSQDSPVLKSLLEEPQHNDINTIQQYAAQQNYAGNSSSEQQNHHVANNQVSPVLRSLLEVSGHVYATQQYAAEQNYAGDNSKRQSPIAANSQDSPVSRSSQEASRQSDINTVQQYAAQQNYMDSNNKQQSPIAVNYQVSPIARPLQEVSSKINAVQQYTAQQNYADNNNKQQNHLAANNQMSPVPEPLQVSPILRPLLEASKQRNIYTTQQYATQQNYVDSNNKQQHSPIAASYQDSSVSRPLQEALQQSNVNIAQQFETQQNYPGNNNKEQNQIAVDGPKCDQQVYAIYPWMKFDVNPGNEKKRERKRQTYMQCQTLRLEEAFYTNSYLNKTDRLSLAKQLNLSEKQIKIWFQNRRMKAKKEQQKLSPISNINQQRLSCNTTSVQEPTISQKSVVQQQQPIVLQQWSMAQQPQPQHISSKIHQNYQSYP